MNSQGAARKSQIDDVKKENEDSGQPCQQPSRRLTHRMPSTPSPSPKKCVAMCFKRSELSFLSEKLFFEERISIEATGAKMS